MTGLNLARFLALPRDRDDLSFYKQDSIQKLIDIQWSFSYKVLFVQTMLYIWLVTFPFIHVVMYVQLENFKTKSDHYVKLLDLSLLGRLLLLVVELAQLKINRW